MPFAGGRVWCACARLNCGSNRCDGHATIIAEHRLFATAKRLAYNRVQRVKYNVWRSLRCPIRCRRKVITYIDSPAPELMNRQYFKARKIWWVQYTVRWRYRADCRSPRSERARVRGIRKDAKAFWTERVRKGARRGVDAGPVREA